MKKFIMAVCFVLMIGCTNESDAKRALEAESYQNITYTGWKVMSCGQDDFYSTGFCADNANGKRVCGTVCSGILFKNATIRY